MNDGGRFLALSAGAGLLVLATASALTAQARSHGVDARLGQLPILFEPAGTPPGAAPQYLARAPGFQLSVSAAGAVVCLRPPQLGERRNRLGMPSDSAIERLRSSAPPVCVTFRWVGADAGARAWPAGESSTRINYLMGNDPAGWRTGIQPVGRVRYADIYRGIDVIYYGNERQLEYDLVVAPNADPRCIQFEIGGVERVEITADGDLVLRLGAGEIRQRRPVVYQEAAGRRQEVAGRYALDPANPSRVGFVLGDYDRDRPLVIDPVLIYASYLGGTLFDACNALAVDAAGNLYVAGETASVDFPTAEALYSTNRGGNLSFSPGYGNEAFVAKFDPAGTNLVFATYLGGSQPDAALGVTVDAAGQVYVVGLTMSPDFPVTSNAWATEITGPPVAGLYTFDAFVTKLSADGARLLYSSFLGGGHSDEALAVAVDNAGNVYLTGETGSPDFPVLNSTNAFAGLTDAFVAKLSTTQGNLIYSALLGGSGDDLGQAIAVDDQGSAFVVGQTTSVNFPVTNGFNFVLASGAMHGFLTRLQPDGAAALYSTYLGGNGVDEVLGVALDSGGNVYLTGDTTSTNFPTAHALVATNTGAQDVFVTKLDATGTNLVYSTYLGGGFNDSGWAIRVRPDGSAVVAGTTFSTNFPLVGALQSTNAGLGDGFVLELNPDGSALTFSTYLGGTAADNLNSLALAPDGSLYVGGKSLSLNFPVIVGSSGFQPAFAGGLGDGIIAKIFSGDAALRIVDTGAGAVTVFWPGILDFYGLQSATRVAGPGAWLPVAATPVLVGGELSVTITNAGGDEYFQLRRQR